MEKGCDSGIGKPVRLRDKLLSVLVKFTLVPLDKLSVRGTLAKSVGGLDHRLVVWSPSR